MAQPNETEDSIQKKHKELCTQLNVDPEATVESWKSYETISQKYTLDGDPIHWIGCALYVACRKSLIPTVGRSGSAVEGNCVSLTKLLRLCNISLIQFFNTIKKWIEMASMPEDFRLRVEKLERNFAVSTVLFQKFKPIFLELFVPLENVDTQKPIKGNKKAKLTPCSVNSVFEFCWCLFVCVKGEFPCLSDDLVNMYHVLLSCIDLVYGNTIMAQRRDLINPSFKGLPPNWSSPNFELPEEPPCIISILCETFQGLYLEAKSMKQYAWKTVIDKFFTKSILKGDEKQFTGLLDLTTFDFNLKSLNKVYETFVLSVGEFDERIFLGEQGTPSKACGDEISRAIASFPPPNIRSLVGDTPLTGRRHLKHKSEPLTPVSSTTHSVERLHAYLSGCTNAPSPSLMALIKDCKDNPMEGVVLRQKEMGAQFLVTYAPLSSEDTAGNRLNLAEVLHYRLLEQIIRDEIRKKPHINLQSLLGQEVFHQTLFACCVEIVIYTYGFQNARFPWVLDCFRLDPFYFYKIIEIVVLVIKEKLSRDVVKHLNAIEEQVLESLAWTSSSPIWERIKNLGEPIPQWGEVSAPEQAHLAAQHTPTLTIRRLNNITVPGVPQSPVSSATDRFLSPGTELAKKQLFKDSNIKPGQSLLNQNLNNYINTPPSTNGKQINRESPLPLKKVIKAGSLGLFFRKFYSLAVVRMNDLCKNLRLDDKELKQKIWTCLEHSIIYQVDLMRDRHLDQILMCAIYVICKVSNSEANKVERTFTEIMRCYRQQPQATGHVYRSVLISSGPATASNNENEAGGADVARAPIPRSPPSPGRPAGQSVRHASQERGDLIKFYNTVYVRCMQQFALRFSRAQTEECTLSPLPPREAGGPGQQAPWRVSEHHHLYVRPLSHSTHQGPPLSTHLTYRFSRSPAKDLQDINCLMSQECVELGGGGQKRAAEGAPPSCSPEKKLAAPPLMSRKIHGLIIDRQTKP